MRFIKEMRAQAEDVIMRATDRENKDNVPTPLEVRLATDVLTLIDAFEFADKHIALFFKDAWNIVCDKLRIRK